MNDMWKTENNKVRKILIVDDHPAMRLGLRSILESEEDLEICGEAEDASTALAKIEEEKPDLVIIDLMLESESGLELIKDIKTRWPELKLLVVSMHEETVFAERALRAGALGYVSKSKSGEELIQAIRQTLVGETVLEEDVSNLLIRRAIHGGASESVGVESLSDRELQVFELIGKGQTVRDISEGLNVSVKTVETHREHIKEKLGLESAADLLRYATLWLSAPPPSEK
jgi:DNA-binding NarL/FixJ family response regulator